MMLPSNTKHLKVVQLLLVMGIVKSLNKLRMRGYERTLQNSGFQCEMILKNSALVYDTNQSTDGGGTVRYRRPKFRK